MYVMAHGGVAEYTDSLHHNKSDCRLMWTNTVHCRMHVWVPTVDQALNVKAMSGARLTSRPDIRLVSGGITDLLANEQGKLVNGNNGKLGLHLRHVLIWTLLDLRPVVIRQYLLSRISTCMHICSDTWSEQYISGNMRLVTA